MPDDLLSIGELVRRTGVAHSALRYYEELGLVTPAGRVSGHRRYDPASAAVLGVIRLLQETGFTLGEIKTILDGGSSADSTWRDMTEAKVHELDDRIEKSQAAKHLLEHALHCLRDDLAECDNFRTVVQRTMDGEPLQEAHRH